MVRGGGPSRGPCLLRVAEACRPHLVARSSGHAGRESACPREGPPPRTAAPASRYRQAEKWLTARDEERETRAVPLTSLQGRTAVVTGGASGIGRALSLLFAREGADVVVADLDEAGMAETVAGVTQAGRRGLAVKTDVSRLDRRAGARRARVRRVRRGPRALQQRGRRPLGRARGRHPPGLGVGDGRQPLGRHPRRGGLRAAHDRPEATGTRREHRVHGRAHRLAGTRRLQHHQVRGRRPLRDAAEGPARATTSASRCSVRWA